LAARQATEWLQVYANDLASGQYSANQWRSLIRKQRDAVDSLSSDEITRASVLSLVRRCAVQAASLGDDEEALRLAAENLDLVPATTNDLVEASNWATDHQLYPVVFELYAKNRPMFDRSAVLLYGYAFALRGKGDERAAVRVADDAYRLSPLGQTKDAAESLQPRQLEEIAKLRREIAVSLRARGMFEWAAREYQDVIDSLPFDSLDSVSCRSELSIMYGELDRHQDVIDLLGPLIERIAKDDEFRAKVNANQNIGNYIRSWRSRSEYHSALLDLEKHTDGDTEQEAILDKARERMFAAYIANPRDIDVLIKMYRTKGDATWRNRVKGQLVKAKSQSLEPIKQLQLALEPPPHRPRLSSHPADLASVHRGQQSTTCPDFDESTCNTALHAGHLIFTLISFFVLSESAVRHSSWRAPSCCPDGAIRSYADLNPLILLLTLKPENDQRVRQTARSPPWDTVIGLTILQARRRGCAIPNLGSSSIHGISFSAAHFLRPIPNALAMPTKSVLSGTV
jgi:tetratricopeptide (TPR) repeat protein